MPTIDFITATLAELARDLRVDMDLVEDQVSPGFVLLDVCTRLGLPEEAIREVLGEDACLLEERIA